MFGDKEPLEILQRYPLRTTCSEQSQTIPVITLIKSHTNINPNQDDGIPHPETTPAS